MDEDEADKTHADGARAELAKLLAVLGMLEAARARDLELYAEDAQDDPFWQLLRMVLLIRIYADYIGSDRVDAAGIKRWLRGHSVRAYIPGSPGADPAWRLDRPAQVVLAPQLVVPDAGQEHFCFLRRTRTPPGAGSARLVPAWIRRTPAIHLGTRIDRIIEQVVQ